MKKKSKKEIDVTKEEVIRKTTNKIVDSTRNEKKTNQRWNLEQKVIPSDKKMLPSTKESKHLIVKSDQLKELESLEMDETDNNLSNKVIQGFILSF